MPDETDKQVIEAEGIVERIKPMLAGRSGPVQGAVLADLLSLWIAGHHPRLRDEILAEHIATVRRLVPHSEKEIFGPRGWPVQ